MQILDWVIGVESENDFLIEANDIPEIEEVNDKIFEYNQAKYHETYNSCTIFGSAGAVSDLFDYEFSYEELLDFNEKSYTHWRTRGKWWWVYMAVDLVREMRNEKNENKLLSFRTSIDDGTMVDALNKWHSLVTSYHWNSKYNKDFKEDGKLDWVVFWQSTYWHCIRIRKIWGLVHVVDNYFPRKYNVYELADFRELVKRWVFSKFQYLFLKLGLQVSALHHTNLVDRAALAVYSWRKMLNGSHFLLAPNNWRCVVVRSL